MTTEPSRLDRIEANLERTTEHLNTVTVKLDTLANNVTEISYKLDNFINTTHMVLGRSTMLDEIIINNNARTALLGDVVVGINRNLELHQQRFEENQRSTNAALERLEAILIKLMDK